MQREENATSIRLLNHDSSLAHVDAFRRMKRTSFRRADLDGGDNMQAKRFIPERAYMYICLSAAGRSSLSFFFLFLEERKEHMYSIAL